MAASMIPSLVTSFTNGIHTEVNEKVASAVKFNMLIAIPSAMGMTVLAQPIVQMLFGSSDYVTGGKLLLIGSSAIIFYALSTVTSAVLQGINNMRLPVIHSAISLGVHIIIVVVLLQFANLGLAALVIGNVTYPMLVCALNWRAVGKLLEYKQEIKTTFLIPLACSGIMGVFTWLIYQGLHMLIPSNTFCTLFAFAVAVIVYFVSLILLKGVKEEELHSFPMGRTLTTVAKKMHLL
jgi:stage V sporulation protein B